MYNVKWCCCALMLVSMLVSSMQRPLRYRGYEWQYFAGKTVCGKILENRCISESTFVTRYHFILKIESQKNSEEDNPLFYTYWYCFSGT